MGIIGGGFGLILRDSGFLNWNRRGLLGICIALCGIFGLGCDFSVVAFGSPLWFWSFRWIKGEGHDDKCYGEWHGINVSQKLLTRYNYRNTVIDMANVLPQDKQIAVISALAEGSSIRSIERITSIHRDTIMRQG